MDKQILRESYEYIIPNEDLDGIAKASVSSFKKVFLLLLSIALLILAIGLLAQTYTVMFAGLSITAFAALIIAMAIKNTKKSIRSQKDFPSDRCYRLRFYDDFFVLEVSSGEGVALLSTVPISSVSITGENEKYIVITNSVYSVPVPKSEVTPGSFITLLYNLKGKKPAARADAPKFFAEPKEALGIHAGSDDEKINTHSTLTVDSAELSDTAIPETDAVDMSLNIENEQGESCDPCEEKEPSKESERYVYESVLQPAASAKIKTAGLFTFIFAIASIVIAIIASAICIISGTSNHIPLFVISLLPVSSIVIGIVLCKKGERWTKNILVGILALLMIFSMVDTEPVFDVDEMRENALAFSAKVEKEINIDIPDLDEPFYLSSSEEILKELSSNLSKEDSIAFVEYAKANPDKFVASFASEYVGLLPSYDRENDTRVALLYNQTTKGFNKIPNADGTYHMIYVFLYEYEDETGFLKVVEYDVDYTTETATIPTP